VDAPQESRYLSSDKNRDVQRATQWLLACVEMKLPRAARLVMGKMLPSMIAKVQRARSEVSRCARTDTVLGTPAMFSSLVSKNGTTR
jgi:urease accessory protein UreF